MPIFERQAEGIAAITAVAVLVCVCKFAAPLFSFPPAVVPFSTSEKGTVPVSLAFAGEEKGVFFLPQRSKVSDLMAAAGIDPYKLEKRIASRPVKSGYHIRIDGEGGYHTAPMEAAQSLALDLPLDVNSLSLSELDMVPGVGEKTAANIIALRNEKGAFCSVEELMEVRGIKEKKLAKFKKYLFVDADACRGAQPFRRQ